MASLRLVPISIREATRWVEHHHRHNRPPRGALFALGVESVASGQLVGVAMVGRPIAQALQDGRTCEVIRVCTDGTRDACSFLLSRARRAAGALGYSKVITYTLVDEGGASLRGAGLRDAAYLEARSWAESNRARRRHDQHTIGERIRWEIET